MSSINVKIKVDATLPGITESDVAVPATPQGEVDPHELRAELESKRNLLNILEHKGVNVAHSHELKSQIASALTELDAIIAEAEDNERGAV
jgi:hypothetical protein